jgi:hypothetical protein
MTKVRDAFVRGAMFLSLFVPIYFAVAAFGTKFGLLDWRVGFGQMTFAYGPLLMLAAGGIALLALGASLLVKPRGRGAALALAALAIPAAGIGYGAYMRQASSGIPPIHDISTDLVDPPGFSEEVQRARAAVADVNSLDLAGKTAKFGPRKGTPFVTLHQEAYGDIQPYKSDLSPGDMFQIALDTASTQGWAIGQTDEASGRIEAVAETFFYGFKDDIAIRLRAAPGGGTIVDVRSVSRVGASDIGANAKRVRKYLSDLDAAMSAAATAG